MPYRSTLNAYVYDGSFDGMLCCVFTAIADKELPADIFPEDAAQATLCPPQFIETDPAKARRVRDSIPRKISREALEWVEDGFLSCEARKERLILDFLRKGYRAGPQITRMLWDETVSRMQKAVQFLRNEAHLSLEFLRFSERNGVLTAVISPKNQVLPRIAGHFAQRFPGEAFLIYDNTHGMALVHLRGKCGIIPADSMELPAIDETEAQYQALWRQFYKTIAIEGRYNPVCRRTHCPQRYWQNMTELCGFTEKPGTGRVSAALSGAEPLAKPDQQPRRGSQQNEDQQHAAPQEQQVPPGRWGLPG